MMVLVLVTDGKVKSVVNTACRKKVLQCVCNLNTTTLKTATDVVDFLAMRDAFLALSETEYLERLQRASLIGNALCNVSLQHVEDDEYRECPYCHGRSATCEDCGGSGRLLVEEE